MLTRGQLILILDFAGMDTLAVIYRCLTMRPLDLTYLPR